MINNFNFAAMAKWFETWFDSPYYHQLYKDRNNAEAERFITNLVQYLNPTKKAHFLDLACGKGRHAIQLSKFDLYVEGADYSENSILYATQFANENLHFFKHDMREPLARSYDYILNLFTSFGYFDTRGEHLQTLEHIYNSLSSNGTFVFDFLNLSYVQEHLIPNEHIEKDGINFLITREITAGQIIKAISFKNDGGEYCFKEKVMAFSRKDLEDMFAICKFKTKALFGNYDLETFDENHSKRLIFILQK